MLSDFERKQMRERKKREEAAKAPAGRMALQYAEQQKKAAAAERPSPARTPAPS